eukprot:4033495-Ditylum_brightwellii.AAC.1
MAMKQEQLREERRKQALERLRMELPSKSIDDCLDHWTWYDQMRLRKRREKDATAGAQRKRVELIITGKKKVDELKHFLEMKTARNASITIHKAIRYEQHARLKLLRGAREEAAKLAAEQKERNDNRIEEMRRKRERQQTEERMAIKQVVDDFKEKNRREAERLRTEQHELLYLQELERLRRMERNNERISYREKLRKENFKRAQSEAVLASQAEEHRLERLSALAASVPYYYTITNMTADLHKTTAARIHDVYEDVGCSSGGGAL